MRGFKVWCLGLQSVYQKPGPRSSDDLLPLRCVTGQDNLYKTGSDYPCPTPVCIPWHTAHLSSPVSGVNTHSPVSVEELCALFKAVVQQHVNSPQWKFRIIDLLKKSLFSLRHRLTHKQNKHHRGNKEKRFTPNLSNHQTHCDVFVLTLKQTQSSQQPQTNCTPEVKASPKQKEVKRLGSLMFPYKYYETNKQTNKQKTTNVIYTSSFRVSVSAAPVQLSLYITKDWGCRLWAWPRKIPACLLAEMQEEVTCLSLIWERFSAFI